MNISKFAVIGLALLAAGCDLRGKILHVGDSNVVFMAGTLTNTEFMNEEQHLPTFAAVLGSGLRDVADWVDILGQIGDEYDATVVHMGVNDCMTVERMGESYTFDEATYDAAIDDLMDALPSGPVIFLDVPYTTANGYSNPCQVNVNLAWQDAYYRHSPRIVYLNSNAIVSSLTNAQRFVDGLHFSPAAQALLAAAVRAELDARF